MKPKYFVLLPALAVTASLAALAPDAGRAAAGAAHPNLCAPPAGAQELVDPPNVEVWNLPLDAQGEHELILAVHHGGKDTNERYCYRYRWNGIVQTIAPTIRVHQGEHFAIRIVNDVAGQSKGEHVASTAIPP